jgi:hypothetical protein
MAYAIAHADAAYPAQTSERGRMAVTLANVFRRPGVFHGGAAGQSVRCGMGHTAKLERIRASPLTGAAIPLGR